MNVYELASRHKQQIISRDRETLTRLTVSYSEIRLRLESQISQILDDVASARANGIAVGVSWLQRQGRLESLLNQTRGQVDQFARDTEQAITLRQYDEAQHAEQNAFSQIRAAIGRPHSEQAVRIYEGLNRLPVRAIERMVGVTGNGSPLRAVLAPLGNQAARSIEQALITGIATGQNPRVVARQTREAFGGNLSRALTTARTEHMRAYRESTREVYKENPAVVKGWKWMATLGPRSCACCIAMHGTEHTNDEVLDGHPNCRCTQFPIVPTWEELGFKSVPNEPDHFGINGEEWFAGRSVNFQREVLGPLGAMQYRNGTPLSDWVGRRESRSWGTMRYQRSLKEVQSGPPPNGAIPTVKIS